MEEESYVIKTKVFEGPLELLLHLIEKRKLHISDISLAMVTEDFLGYIKVQKELPISKSANFVLVASTLLLIKSKSLLPTLSLSPEEEGDIESLERRLKLYKCFLRISPIIGRKFGKTILFSKSSNIKMEPVFSPDKLCSTPSLYLAIVSVMKNLPTKEIVPKVLVEKVINLEEMITKLSERISNSVSLSFREFSGGNSEKANEMKITVIVGFLAMLELVKRGVLDVKQENHFEDITMHTEHINIPRYS